MSIVTILGSFLNPPVLFFMLGALAVGVRSNLKIPTEIGKFLSLYLLMAIGYKGGVALHRSGLTWEVGVVLAAGILLSAMIPLAAFFILRRKLRVQDAAAIAATYGSVSAVTFVTAVAFLEKQGVSYGGHMVAVMALMESPAIIAGVLLNRHFGSRAEEHRPFRETLHEAATNGSVFLLLGSLVIGFVGGDNGKDSLKFFTEDLFKGMLAFFLLDMGILAASRLRDLKGAGWFLGVFAVLFPLFCAAVGIATALGLGMSEGDALLLAVLCAGASYIAVPAAMKLAIPDANPSIYVPMALGVTFPFNIAIGIPLYLQVIRWLWR